MELAGFLPLIAIPMLIMTGAVTIDAHDRNKYATPWFLLVSTIGIFGVVLYYVTIRTEERSEGPPIPSGITKIGLPILSLVGAFCAFGGLIGMLGGELTLVWLYGVPAMAIGVLLYYDYSFGAFERQQLAVECLYALSFGGVLALVLFPRELTSRFVSYHMGTAISLLLTILFPLGWYAVRTNTGGHVSVLDR